LFIYSNTVIVPNPDAANCKFAPAPCTQIYPYRLGNVSPRLEIDQPSYQLQPWGAVVSP